MGRYGAQFVALIWEEQIRMNVRTFTTFSDSAHARLSLEVEGNMYTIVHILDLPSIEEIIPCFYRMILCSGPLQSHTLMYSHYAHLCTNALKFFSGLELTSLFYGEVGQTVANKVSVA